MRSRTDCRRICPRIGKNVTLVASVRIEGDVEIGDNCYIRNNVLIRSGVRLGKGCRVETGVVLGTDPQDLNFKNEESYLIIGDGCRIREYATLSLATGRDEKTVIGEGSMIMSYCHIAHNVKVGKSAIITSGSQIGGYVVIGDNAMIGGLCGVHQFCRIGRLAMLGGCSYLNTDLPPFSLAQGNPARFYGVNSTGLKRAGMAKEKKIIIKECLKRIYHGGRKKSILRKLRKEYPIPEVKELIEFFKTSRKPITRPD